MKEILGYLDQFVWQECFGKTVRVAFDGITDISQLYPVVSFCIFPAPSSPNQFLPKEKTKNSGGSIELIQIFADLCWR